MKGVRVAIVTGAGSGVGAATLARLEKDGFAVAGLDIKNAPYQCDVSDEEQVGATVAQVAADLGRPTVLCNVAGVGRFQHTTEATLDDWNRTIAVNLTGSFLMCRATLAAPARRRRRHRQRGIDGGTHGPAVQRGVLRVEGRRRPADSRRCRSNTSSAACG